MIVRTEDACYEIEELPDRSFRVVMREVSPRTLPPQDYVAACERINDWIVVDTITVKVGHRIILSGLRQHSRHEEPCTLCATADISDGRSRTRVVSISP